MTRPQKLLSVVGKRFPETRTVVAACGQLIAVVETCAIFGCYVAVVKVGEAGIGASAAFVEDG